MKAIFKELLKNFWGPLLISIFWAGFKTYRSTDVDLVSTFLSNFVPALFFLSWILGQYKRAEKQINDKNAFDHVTTKLSAIVEKLENQTVQLAGFTLGDSKHLTIYVGNDRTNPNIATLSFSNDGKYPVFDVRVHWVNIDDMGGDAERFGAWNYFDKQTIATIKPGETEMDVLRFDMSSIPYKRVLVYVTWRNGSYVVEYEITRNETAITFQQLNRIQS